MGSLAQWFKNLFASQPRGKGKAKPLPRIDIGKRFDLLNRTGQGSMSKVWRAHDRSLGRTVCLKILDKEKTARFEDRFKGLNRPTEGAVCMALRHQNIVQTYEHGMSKQGEPFLVMELIEGMGLNYLIETHSPQLEGKRIDYLVQLADALEYVHAQGFIHRDICPRNVMVTREGLVKLIDFGLTIPNRPEFCRPGNRTGTPNYLAPEVIRRVTTDARVDLFALGVTAYEVFTHNLPWEKGQSQQTLLSHMNSPGKDPADYLPDIDRATRTFLIKGVERDPRERFQAPTEFRETLKRLPKQDW
jgi:eukaryotic-like serine/threonine-protein kinase